MISVTQKQALESFVCNCLEVNGLFSDSTRNKLILSRRAEHCLEKSQREILDAYVDLVALPVDKIEDIGGGSARCMVAEIFNPLKLE